MLEKEVKILDINVEEVCKKIEALWGIKTFDWVIHDVYYDFPDDGKKHKMEGNKRMFRVRKKWETHLYTIKNKRKDVEEVENVIAKDEHEMEITDVDSFTEVLEKYGMIKTREKIKYRISYQLAWAEFDIDKYDEIPALLEIEEDSDTSIQFWIKRLWLEEYEQLLGWSRKLFKHYWIEYLNL